MTFTTNIVAGSMLILSALVSECLAGYCSGYYDIYNNYKYGFYCPRLFDSVREKYCCGSRSSKYCCSSSSYYPSSSSYNIVGTAVGVVFGLVCFVIFVSLITCCFCATCPLYQRRHQGRILAARPALTTTTVTTGPVAYTAASGGQVLMANPQPPPYAPAYPPPAYNNTITTTTTNGFGYNNRYY